jgi:hypothetical protein
MDRKPFVLSHAPGRRAAAAFALVALAGAGSARAAAGAIDVELRASADVARAQVLLSDVATIRGGDSAAAARLGQLPVGEVAENGAPTVVDRDSLARWVRAHAELPRQDVAWSGAARCRIQFVAAGGAAMPVAPASSAAGTAVLVVKGRYATLHSIAGGIHLESRVEVLQDGALGQEVKVRLINATDAVIARVSGLGEVEVTQ